MKITNEMVEKARSAFNQSCAPTFTDLIRAAIEAVAADIEQAAARAENEACAQAMEERAALYRGPILKKRDGLTDIPMTWAELCEGNAEASEHGAYAIRARHATPTPPRQSPPPSTPQIS